MKTTVFGDLLVFAATCLVATFASASELKRADVAADPAWVLHLDCDRLRASSVGQFILGELDKPEAQAKLAALQAVLNFDLRKQLHGVTLYGSSSKPEDGVLMLYADFDAERLLTLAKAAKDYKATSHKSNTIHSWVDEKKKPAEDGTRPHIYAAIHGKRVIFGQAESSVAKALDVLDGGPNLQSGNAYPQLGAAGNSSFIQAGVRRFDLPESDPNSAMFKLSKMALLEVGEAQQRINAVLSLTAADEEVAKNVSSIAQGVVALLKLQKDKPENEKLANALSLKQDGAVNTISFSMPASDVVDLLKAGAARKAQQSEAK